MKNKRKSESKKKKFEEFLQNPSYDITLKAYDLKTLNDKIIKSDTSFISSDLGFKLFFDFSKFIKNEALSELAILDDGIESPSDVILTILFRNFKLNDFKKGTVQDAIIKYIKNLETIHFIMSFEVIKKKIMSLREEKIDFWESLLEEYKKRQRYYDKELLERLIKLQKQSSTARRHGNKVFKPYM